MKLNALDRAELAERLRAGRLSLVIGPFHVRVRSELPDVCEGLSRLYGDFPLCDPDAFMDFSVEVRASGGLRRWVWPQVRFLFDGEAPFKPLPRNQAYPFFEWGLNWCVAQHAHEFLIIHAAVLEREGRALVLPGDPGAGKSTLCAALMASGWRLLSDEMALLPERADGLLPMPRPIALKNDSIERIRAFAPQLRLGRSFHDTAKGTVAHVQPTRESVAAQQQAARPALLVFPRFDPDAREAEATAIERPEALLRTVRHAFNYDLLGEEGFRRMRALIDASACHQLRYGSLEDSLQGIRRLWERTTEAEA